MQTYIVGRKEEVFFVTGNVNGKYVIPSRKMRDVGDVYCLYTNKAASDKN